MVKSNMEDLRKERDFKEVAEYRDYLRMHPKLRFLFFELTDSCNLNCLHCGSNCLSSNRTFLDFALIKKTLDEVAAVYETKDIWVCLTGGSYHCNSQTEHRRA